MSSFVLLALLASANPVRLASEARFDLLADESLGELAAPLVVGAEGQVARQNWLPEARQPLSLSASFPVSRIGWREFSLRFTPANSGAVRLSLMGPWAQSSPGVLFQEEVLWDVVRAEGATVTNGSFEELREGAPVGWRAEGAASVVEADAMLTAVAGRRMARTWHNARCSTTLQVKAGTQVTVSLAARAATPEGFVEMPRLAGRDTPAHRAAAHFKRGANLGNFLEVPPGQDWGVRYDARDLQRIHQEGFDHVRIPIGWHHHAGPAPDFQLTEAIYSRVDPLVAESARLGLGVILNIHHFDEFTSNPAGQRAKFEALWRQIGAHYAEASPLVAFELINEPKDAATTEVLNPIYADVIAELRRSNPRRTLFLGPGSFNKISELPRLVLPQDDNLIVTVHCYDPFYFTHQGASWTSPEVRQLQGVRFPGPPSTPLAAPEGASRGVRDWIERYNTLPTERNPSGPVVFQGPLRQAKEWSEYYGRPLHLGEFGAYERADAESRSHYYRAFRLAAEDAGIGWCVWDWKAGFKYWDDRADAPTPGMREALFGGASR